MHDIFISYASANRSEARALAQHLEQEGWSVWWDRKIPVGESFSKVLEAALEEAKCVVVLWSKASRSSDWVQNEAAEGKRRGILVPAFIEETTPPFEFQRIQAANLVGWEDHAPDSEMDQLLKAIHRVVGGEYKPAKASGNPASNIDAHALKMPQSPDVKPEPTWKQWIRLGVLFLIMVPTMMGVFKALYPSIPVYEALTSIMILSLLTGVGLNYCWSYWRRLKMKK